MPNHARPARSDAQGWHYVDSLTPHLFAPTPERPVRAKLRMPCGDTKVRPHCHTWAQLTLSTGGTMRLHTPQASFIVPPGRALWIPPSVKHAVTLVQTAELRTLYLYQIPGQCGPGLDDHDAWSRCCVLEVSRLLHALACDLSFVSDGAAPPPTAGQLARERHVSTLIIDELRHARHLNLRVDMPRDKRLRTLCEAVLRAPSAHARHSAASLRTLARLFHQELGCTYLQWRQQAILAVLRNLRPAGSPWAASRRSWATRPAPSAPWCNTPSASHPRISWA